MSSLKTVDDLCVRGRIILCKKIMKLTFCIECITLRKCNGAIRIGHTTNDPRYERLFVQLVRAYSEGRMTARR